PQWSMTEYGLLAYWQGNPIYVPGQVYQAMLVAVETDGVNIRLGNWAPIIFKPQTATAEILAGKGTGQGDAGMKIDPAGIFYYDGGYAFPSGPGGVGTYVANSKGLNIGLPAPVISPRINIPIPSFCPCSPVAVPVAGN
ncbi:MAG: hypothetical protein ACRDNZ_04575, partial [Streptosporangiaceae bacterium]